MSDKRADDIAAEAARWAMRLRADASPENQAALASWLGDDRRKRGALLQAEAASILIEDFVEHGAAPAKLAGTSPPSFVTRRKLLAGACVATLAAGIGVGVTASLSSTSYRTATGEIRRVPLADGSVAVVNTQTHLNVELGVDARSIRLAQGEAWFQVAHDTQRPFTVESGPARVRAVGTAFSVRRRNNGSDVVVSEGVVDIWTIGNERHRERLSAGHRAFVADDIASGATIEAADVDRDLIWREGKIDLAGQTLSYAAEEFNRYNRRKLVIADPALSSERFYGIFEVDDPEDFAIAVHDSMRVPVLASDPDEIRIGVSSS